MIDVLIRCPHCYKVLRFFTVSDDGTTIWTVEKCLKVIQQLMRTGHKDCPKKFTDRLGLKA